MHRRHSPVLQRVRPALLLFLLTLVFPATAAAAGEITSESVLDQMNAARSARGLPLLVANSRLNAAAEDRMRDMEEHGFWSHDGPAGASPFRWLTRRGYRYGFAGENLARGFETPSLLVDSWMESEGHRENILFAEFEQVGIAVIEGSVFGRATGKSVVVLFARPK